MEEYIEVKRPVISKSIMNVDVDVNVNMNIIEELNILVYTLPKNSDKNNDKEKEKRNEGFCILANKMNISNHLKKTKFCNIFIQEGICDRKLCNFAHSIEEYNFPLCAFSDKCKVKKCRFKHTIETLDEYKKRIDFKVPENIK